jgi:integrase
MPKRNIPNYRLHKATGQGFVELGGRRFYLGKYGSKASREEYERRVAEYLTNGRKLPPTGTKAGITCQELAIHFLEWAEEYFMNQPRSFAHIRKAMEFLVKHYGREPVDNFAPMSLVFVQKKLVEHGYARPVVNKYVGFIKRAFKHGAKFGWVNAQTSYALQVVDNLKKGRTKAHEYRDIKPIDTDDFEKTLAELPKRLADMARVQRLCVMRPQDVCNLRLVDIDRTGDVWLYRP